MSRPHQTARNPAPVGVVTARNTAAGLTLNVGANTITLQPGQSYTLPRNYRALDMPGLDSMFSGYGTHHRHNHQHARRVQRRPVPRLAPVRAAPPLPIVRPLPCQLSRLRLRIRHQRRRSRLTKAARRKPTDLRYGWSEGEPNTLPLRLIGRLGGQYHWRRDTELRSNGRHAGFRSPMMAMRMKAIRRMVARMMAIRIWALIDPPQDQYTTAEKHNKSLKIQKDKKIRESAGRPKSTKH